MSVHQSHPSGSHISNFFHSGFAIQFRSASSREFSFAWDLYRGFIQTLMDRNLVSHLKSQCARMRESFAANRVNIVLIDGKCGGWVEVEETHDALHLHNLYLIRDRQRLGIGSAIINQVLAIAQQKSKPVRLEVMKNNKDAYRLYKRLGFGTDERDEQKIYMSRHSHVP